ncbi:MAG: HD domain-containing protein, partial [Kordiimonadaceae bacterium]|nr:HD domain-containing protein [Kordiimonadaceae bacterium]
MDLIDRRTFIASVGGAAALAAMDANQKADALEQAMTDKLDVIMKPAIATTYRQSHQNQRRKEGEVYHMGHDPRLEKMSDKPTLLEYFDKRIGHSSHLLQSARLAKINGLPEKIILACLLHDISGGVFIKTDHGYYGSQLVAPYVDEEVSWAIKYHQSLRFIPDEEVGYPYPEAYIRYFGEDFKPEPYIFKHAEYARNHKWYMTARQICINDVYSFDPNVVVKLEDFHDIIARNWK